MFSFDFLIKLHNQQGICFVEWADKLPSHLQNIGDPLRIELSFDKENGRVVQFSGSESWCEVFELGKSFK
jgi:tRNA A37 threonylcarbamoyladenosine biosynthesis protein TsaE